MWVWSFLFGNLKRVVQVAAVLGLLAMFTVAFGTTWLTHNPEAIEGAAEAVAERLDDNQRSRQSREEEHLNVHQRRAREAEKAARAAWESESYPSPDNY